MASLNSNREQSLENEAENPMLPDIKDLLDDTKCGLWAFRHPICQKLASKKTYVLIYGLIGMSHFAISTYFVGTISTLEKRFQLPSFYTGLINSACDVGVICTTLTAAYLGRASHKTRWVAWGTALVGLSCYVRLIPHWLFGPGENALRLTDSDLGPVSEFNSSDSNEFLCGTGRTKSGDCQDGNAGSVAAIIFLVAHVLQGIGSSVYYSLGVAYLDDNARKSKVPVLLAITQCFKMIGPTFGYLLASYSLSLFIEPFMKPVINNDDPRWVGAWWIGWGPLGTACMALGFCMAMFPKQLPRTVLRNINLSNFEAVPVENPKISLQDFKKTMHRLLKNKVLMFNSISTVCFTFGFLGQWIFLPKYMETQFHRSASDVSFISGSIGLLFTAAGILVSAIVISKFQPSARTLAAWNVFTELLDCVGFVAILFIGCESLKLHGLGQQTENNFQLGTACNSGCGCSDENPFSPVCQSGTTYFSACHAGCTDHIENPNVNIFANCSCATTGDEIINGACAVDCGSAFAFFIAIHCVQRFFGATGRAGNTLIHFRSVSTMDKPVSVGFLEFLMCAFGFIPAPIIFGILIDSSCLVWGQTCGERGNCWIYDVDKLRYYVNLPILVCVILGTIWDIGVWYYVKDMPMYDEDEAHNGRETRQQHQSVKLKTLNILAAQ